MFTPSLLRSPARTSDALLTMVYNEAAMDSQVTLGVFGTSAITLVDPPAQGDVVLIFAPDNMRNSGVHRVGSPNERLYTVQSNQDLTVTELRDAHGLVAKIEYRTMLPDQVSLRSRGFKPIRMSSWLKEVGSKSYVVFEAKGAKYLWKTSRTGQVNCYGETPGSLQPIAWYDSTRSGPRQRALQPTEAEAGCGHLHLTNAASHVQDDLVASLLVVQMRAWLKQDRWAKVGTGYGYSTSIFMA
ncbi:hypothetical protein PUNSTDRAFT_122347 [Punctularia strigosozonata HHB-11173 SS5]|uniref:uncharacterized protein n=1 Tax=Punctularia strigosozonata (strain HHB-11173) TaxID=741275 RepID=UPI0004416A47|nr:uncharacterized protein PUNSTDRAFT_122347 [Punctularia strigosozonata HHB-11173 SS5]EIN05420.1 hypothetical protein PUNSTDRAFT_122347 [Punctularia strigosozonata HHB-11173 SS5]